MPGASGRAGLGGRSSLQLPSCGRLAAVRALPAALYTLPLHAALAQPPATRTRRSLTLRVFLLCGMATAGAPTPVAQPRRL
eukprot:SAG31_NODE_2109_length_6426_cov_13.928244_5_plen_81_part_00